jgi:hypothetical protein
MHGGRTLHSCISNLSAFRPSAALAVTQPQAPRSFEGAPPRLTTLGRRASIDVPSVIPEGARHETADPILFASGLLALTLIGIAAAEQLEDGDAAFSRGDYAEAMRLLRPLAEWGCDAGGPGAPLYHRIGELRRWRTTHRRARRSFTIGARRKSLSTRWNGYSFDEPRKAAPNAATISQRSPRFGRAAISYCSRAHSPAA